MVSCWGSSWAKTRGAANYSLVVVGLILEGGAALLSVAALWELATASVQDRMEPLFHTHLEVGTAKSPRLLKLRAEHLVAADVGIRDGAAGELHGLLEVLAAHC